MIEGLIPFLNRASIYLSILLLLGFPRWLSGKESACNAGVERDAGVQSLGQEDPLEEEMATRSSIFAWRMLWTERPEGLQFMGSQKVGHDLK